MSTFESLHPIFVHFPIALLSIYAVLECIRYKKLLKQVSFFYIKAFLAVVGFSAGLVAASAGPEGSAVHSWLGYSTFVRPTVRNIVEMHSTFASATLFIFGIIAFSYIVRLLNDHVSVWASKNETAKKVWKWLLCIGEYISRPAVVIPLAILGLVAVTITGSLGGAIVYGPNIDPVVSAVFYFLFGVPVVQ